METNLKHEPGPGKHIEYEPGPRETNFKHGPGPRKHIEYEPGPGNKF